MFKRVIAGILALFFIICIALSLTGCNSIPQDRNAVSYDDSMFVICEATSASKPYYVVYQKDTKVMYVVSSSGYNCGTFTLLVNPDGTPMLWEG